MSKVFQVSNHKLNTGCLARVKNILKMTRKDEEVNRNLWRSDGQQVTIWRMAIGPSSAPILEMQVAVKTKLLPTNLLAEL
jgi:hypothetical protein